MGIITKLRHQASQCFTLQKPRLQRITMRHITVAVLIAIAAATGYGLIALWPDTDGIAEITERTPVGVNGASFETAQVLSITEGCEDAGDPALPNTPDQPSEASQPTAPDCLLLSVGLVTGPDAGRVIDIPTRGAATQSGLSPGDRVELTSLPTQNNTGTGADTGESTDAEPKAPTLRYELANDYTFSGVFRTLPLALLTLVFAGVVVAVGRLRGLLALGALTVSAGVLLAFLLPALVLGAPGLLVGTVAASAIMFIILFPVHGFNMRTVSALIGTLCGIAIMAGVSLAAMGVTRLSGIGDEASGTLAAAASHIDFRGLLSCSIIIAGLGILNDVTITQASAVWELRAAAPTMPRAEVYRAAMRIGRDHIASTVYTVFFAYVGAALGVLLLLYLYDRPLLSLLTHEDIAIEIVRTLCGSIGLILAVPITSWVAAVFAPGPGSAEAEKLAADPPPSHGHSHVGGPPPSPATRTEYGTLEP